MSPLRIIIVDDELPARQRVEDLLACEEGVEVVGSYGDGREAAEAILDDEPDLVFLDVQMPEVSGLDVVRRVGPAHMPAVVFVTAYDRYALEAFDAQALDYLLKPFEDERFRHALARAREHVRLRRVDALGDQLLGLLRRDGAAPTPPPQDRARRLDRIPVKERDRTFFVPVADIDYIEADGPYAKLHVGRAVHLIRERMHVLEDELDPERFVRIHRSYIVNVERIESLDAYFHGDYVVRLADGTRLRLSRSRREAVQARLGLA